MTASAHDIARELRNRLPDIGVVKLHKLLYYAQGHHLVQWNEPLFSEPIAAWANGPVVVSLWADEKHDRGRPAPRPLSEEAVATIDYVVVRYGDLSGVELIRRTHDEKPWRDVAEDEDSSPNPTIPHEALRDWFEQDPERIAQVAQVERLRRHPAHSFDDRPLSAEQHAAIDRALRGERAQHWTT